MKKYDLSSIMRAAWSIFRKGVASFSAALKMAWANAKTLNAAKSGAGVTEETHTWAGQSVNAILKTTASLSVAAQNTA